MKFTDKENTVIADLGINTDYSQSPAVASQDIMKIVGTTAGGANALLRSLIKKGVFVTNIDEEGEDAVEFTDKGKLVVRELSGDFELPDDDLSAIEEDLEVEMDDDDDEEPVTMVKQAAKKAKAKAKTKKASTATGMRTSHADCSHAKSGSEGKIARAKCRKERAAAAAKANA